MTEHASPASDDVREMDDIELITMWLNGKLTPARAEVVRTRLEEDATFRDLAAPLILLWRDPSHRRRTPRPEGEKEQVWEDFVKRTGFPNRPPGEQLPPAAPRRRPWLRLLLWILLVILGVAAFAYFRPRGVTPTSDLTSTPTSTPTSAPTSAPTSGPKRDPNVALVPSDTSWLALGDSIHAQLSPGASLRVADEPLRGMRHVRLDGTARFRVLPLETTSGTPRPDALVVSTRAGEVTAGESEFTVTARADTTDVHVHANRRPRAPRFSRMMMVDAAVVFDTAGTPLSWSQAVHHIPVRDLDSARIVRGVVPQPFTKRP